MFQYSAGTSTKVTTYKTSSGSLGAAHTNPIVLDANGLPPAPIWLSTGTAVKFVLAPSTDTDPPVSAILSIDNISGINDVTAVSGQEWTAGPAPTYISGTSFSVATDYTTTLHVGRRLKTTNTAGTIYSTIIRSVYGALTTVTVANDSGTLDSGLSALSYGISSADNTSVPFLSRDQQCGRLVYVSSTQIRLDPVDGNTIWVYTGSAWKRRIIPSAGVTSANATTSYIDGSIANLAADTTYYVYLWDNAGVLAMDFSTTAPAVDATSGLLIKTGVATRLLIGMVRTNGSTPGQFQTPALVLSWYKRRGIKVTAALTTTRTQGSTTIVEVNAEARVKFLTWAEEAVGCAYAGWVSNNTAVDGIQTYICMDGITANEAIAACTCVQTTALAQANSSLAAVASLSEGYHIAYLCGNAVTGGTASWFTGSGGGNHYVLTQG